MGDWTLIIRGTGPHHGNHPGDADGVGREAVETLRRHGHRIHHATLMHGGHEQLQQSTQSGPIPGLGEFLPESDLHK